SYSQRNQELWSRMVNALSEIDAETMAPSESFKQPDNIVTKSYCETSGMKPSKLCKKLGLVKSDIYNSKYTPSKTDDSLVDGDAPITVVDGKEVVASSKTPRSEEHTSELQSRFDLV